jgi:membrane protein
MEKGKIRNLPTFLKDVFSQWQNDRAMRMGAALAYYTIFSLPPLLIIAVSTAGFFFGHEAAQGRIVKEIQGLIGKDGAVAVQTMIQNAYHSNKNILATIVGIVTLLIGASGVFAELQDSLNKVWGVEAKPDRSWMTVIKERLSSFTMVFGIGFLLLVSLIIDTILTILTDFFNSLFHSPIILSFVDLGNFVISFLFVTLLFAMIYKVLPDVRLSLKDVGLGAVVTSLLFTMGKYLIGLYLGNSNVGQTYGAAGSVIIMLVWIFYASLIFFFGAEFTQVYVRKYGGNIVPIHEAIIVDTKKCKAVSHPHENDPELKKKDRERKLVQQKKLALIPINGSKPHNIGKQKNTLSGKKSVIGAAFKVILGMFLERFRKPQTEKVQY